MNHQNPPLPQAGIGFSGQVDRKKYWDADIDWHKFNDRKWCRLRFIGPVYMIAQSWIRNNKSKKKFPMFCLGYDRVNDQFDFGKCPILTDFDPFNSENEEIKAISPRKSAFTHAIIREKQKIGNPTGDPSWHPWSPVKLPLTVLRELSALRGMNTFEINGKEYSADVTDPYYGRDISIMYDANAPTPAEKYRVQISDHTPLTDLERSYLDQLYDWDKLIQYPTYESVKKSLQFNGYYNLLADAGGMPPSMSGDIAGSVLTPPPMPPSSGMGSMPPPSAGGFSAVSQPGAATAAPDSGFSTQGGFAPSFDNMLNTPQAPAGRPQVNYQSYQNVQMQQTSNAAAVPSDIPMPPAPSAYGNPAAIPSTLEEIGTAAPAPIENVPQGTVPATELKIVRNEENAEKTFAVKGRPNLSVSEYEALVEEFAGKLDEANIGRGLPLSVWEGKGKANGVRVLNCFGKYRGDTSCMRCPLRPECIHI